MWHNSSDVKGWLSMIRVKRRRRTLSAGINSSSSSAYLALSSSSCSCRASARILDWCCSKSSLRFRASRLTSLGSSLSDLFSFTKSLISVSELMNWVYSLTTFDWLEILSPNEQMCFIIFSKLYFIKLMRDSSSCYSFCKLGQYSLCNIFTWLFTPSIAFLYV